MTSPKHMIYFACDKIKCANVVGNTRHMISQSNRSPKLPNFLLSSPLVLRISESWILFSRIFLHHVVIYGRLKNIKV